MKYVRGRAGGGTILGTEEVLRHQDFGVVAELVANYKGDTELDAAG
jgi:hypothetical protein